MAFQLFCSIMSSTLGVLNLYMFLLYGTLRSPRVHFFLWKLMNKCLTRDNLAKRREVEDPTCLFALNLNPFNTFFDCVVAT
jgi:hypothetical protein